MKTVNEAIPVAILHFKLDGLRIMYRSWRIIRTSEKPEVGFEARQRALTAPSPYMKLRRSTNRPVTNLRMRGFYESESSVGYFLLSIGKPHRQLKAGMQLCLGTV